MDWLVGCLVWLYSFFLSSSLITQEHQKGVSCIGLLLVCVLIRSTGVSRVTIPFRSIFAFFLLSYLFVSCLLLGGESFVSLYGFPLFFIFFYFYEQWWLHLSTMSASSSLSCRMLPCCHFLLDDTLLPCICLPTTKRSNLSFARSLAPMR